MNAKPLLSICIPTYNRAEYLEKSIRSIIDAEAFSDKKIEIVISDNCSSDSTEYMVKKYAKVYKNIKYFRNEENIADRNFALSFRRATGIFRKLSNDTVIYKPDALKYMLELVESYKHDKPVLYFLNDIENDKEELYADLDSFIKRLSINITWIRSLAMWDEDLESLDVMENNVASKLSQVPFLIEIFLKHQAAVVINRDLMEVQNVSMKNVSYGIYEVFGKNYLGFIEKYVERGNLSELTYTYLKKDLLFNFFLHWIINFELDRKQYLTSGEDLRNLVENEYKNEEYFSQYKKLFTKLYTKRWMKEQIKRVLYPIYKAVKDR